MHVGQMHFNEGNGYRRQRIAQRHTGMCVGCRVDDDCPHALIAGGMNALDQSTFVIALKRFQFDAGTLGHPGQCHIDVGEGNPAIVLRLTGTQQVQIGTVQDQDAGLFG